MIKHSYKHPSHHGNACGMGYIYCVWNVQQRIKTKPVWERRKCAHKKGFPQAVCNWGKLVWWTESPVSVWISHRSRLLRADRPMGSQTTFTELNLIRLFVEKKIYQKAAIICEGWGVQVINPCGVCQQIRDWITGGGDVIPDRPYLTAPWQPATSISYVQTNVNSGICMRLCVKDLYRRDRRLYCGQYRMPTHSGGHYTELSDLSLSGKSY